MEPFTLIEENTSSGLHHLFDDVLKFTSAKSADHDLQYVSILRKAFPDLIVTAIPINNCPLLPFAAAGFANATLDLETDSFASWRGYVPPAKRSDSGQLGQSVSFAKYHYKWNEEDFVFYIVGLVQYVLKERRDSEDILGPSTVTDKLIQTIGDWRTKLKEVIWVYDGYWYQDAELWKQVQKASWDKVILDESMKDELVNVAQKFFSSKKVYEELGVPWKRGLMFYGPPGNGKTISIRALMHSLYDREDSIPTLYVKSAPYTFNISDVFQQARALSPCMLVLEDIETIVTPTTRSYFFNEMDGLENNDGLFVVASTNFLDKLDPGLSKRPSRFDRKYEFPLPNEHERTLYCEYWRQKLKSKKSIEFPKKLSPAMAHITSGFSFAFLQECFVATLLFLARKEDGIACTKNAIPFDDGGDNLDDYELWVTFKKQADILRKEIENQARKQSQLLEWCNNSEVFADTASTSIDAQTVRHGCHRCDGVRPSERNTPATNVVNEQRRKGGILPELPFYERKQEVINSAAFQLK